MNANALFEIHVTISPSRLPAFRAACAELRVKCIVIELPFGDSPLQPMTSSFVRGELADAERAAGRIAEALTRRGFDVVRVKIEQHGLLTDVRPRSGAYFEYHAKVVVAQSSTAAAIAAAGASLSANVSRPHERLLTLRAFEMSRAEADARFEALAALGFPLRSRVREYTVLDTNPSLDRGWLEAP